MAETDWNQTKAIFGEALDMQGAERAAYVEGACGGDAALRGRVERLLLASERAAGFLDEPAIGVKLTSAAGGGSTGQNSRPGGGADGGGPGERIGDAIGPYRLIELIGQGGFGAVYLAEQATPVKRRVALKILKPGMDSRQVIARFEAERQALALMDHPGIARVFDAGATEAGRPYFAMELVRGVPITEYCETHALTIVERLALMVQVCHAAQHAHYKGVIHRDLKPANILITVIDGLPVPKIIDFGIAKALADGPVLTDRTLVTGFRGLIGTPAYMSPEQADLAADRIDTRSDVYALGVVLYELLTGATPISSEALSKASLPEVQRLIREVEPARPSSRTFARDRRERTASLPVASAPPASSPTAPRPATLPVDLDWITLKALEKQPSRRYSSASELAADIERFLAHEPILARPPTAAYRTARFVRRHRALAIGAAAVALTALAGLGFAAAGYLEARDQRDAAKRAATEESTSRASAESAEKRTAQALRQAEASLEEARAQTKKADAVRTFLQDVIQSVHPETAPGARNITVAEALDQAAAKVAAGSLKDDPSVEAAVRLSIGRTYRALGDQDRAGEHLRAAVVYATLHPGQADLDEALNSLAVLLAEQNKHAEAEPLLRDILARRRARQGPEHPDVATALNNLAGEAFELGKRDEAEQLYREAIAIREKSLGPAHPLVGGALNNLGFLLFQQARKAEALTCFERAIEIQRKALVGSADDMALAQAIANLGFLLDDAGRAEEAEARLREALAMFERLVGPEHFRVAQTLGNLARVVRSRGQIDEALALSQRGITIRRTQFKPDNPALFDALASHGAMLLDAGKAADALPPLREALDMRRAAAAPGSPSTLKHAENLTNLAAALLETGPESSQVAAAQALPLLRESLTVRDSLKAADWRRDWTLALLGRALFLSEQLTEARPILDTAAASLKSGLETPPAKLKLARNWAAQSAEKMGDLDAASRYRAAD